MLAVFGRKMCCGVASLILLSLLAGCPGNPNQAREDALNDLALTWMRLAIDGTRSPGKGPTVEARKLFQVAAAMYDGWAVYDANASGYFTGKAFKSGAGAGSLEEVAETLSHAVYPVLRDGFKHLAVYPVGSEPRKAYDAFLDKMIELGYCDTTGKPIASDAQAIGSAIGDVIVEYCKTDGANEGHNYADTTRYFPVNLPMDLFLPNIDLVDVNRWQPIRLPTGALQGMLTPHWCLVAPFALPPYEENALRIDPGMPPLYGTATQPQFVNEFMELIKINASLDPTKGFGAADFNMSPRVRGNNTFPSDTDGTGHPVNPATGQRYPDNIMKLGDYYRCQATFLDGLHFSMPAPWWYQLATDVLSGSGVVKERPRAKAKAHDLAFDVKLLFALGGAEHDTGIAVWDVKRFYDWARPIEAIRWLGGNDLLPLEQGLVETVGPGDPLAGTNGEYVGHQKMLGWLGPYEGVGWVLPEEWLPYQAPNFYTPPFPGYTSGHAAFGQAFAVVMQEYLQDAYFPGGYMEFAMDTLPWDTAPLQNIRLQWATYRDVADDAGLARKFCGVHPANDNIKSRDIGKKCGEAAWALANDYFTGKAHGVVYY